MIIFLNQIIKILLFEHLLLPDSYTGRNSHRITTINPHLTILCWLRWSKLFTELFLTQK